MKGLFHSVSYEKNLCSKPFNRITSPLSPYLRYRDMRRKKLPNLPDFKPTVFAITAKRYWKVENDQFLIEREADSDTEHHPEPEIANENLSTTD